MHDRQREREIFDRLLEGMRTGQSGALVLRGDIGVGKTALLDYVVGAASGARVLRATGVELEKELAFAALHQLCAPIIDGLASLPGPQRSALATTFGMDDGEAPDRFLVGLAVLGLLSAAAEERPLICTIDDAQWLDRASAQSLAFVARRLFAESVVVLFSTREVDETFRGIPEVVVTGLAEADARALLEETLTSPIDGLVLDQIVAESNGNPLALLELPRGLSPRELAGGFRVSGRPVSNRIEQSFTDRYRGLPNEIQRLLLLAASDPTGDPILFWRAAARLGLAATTLDFEDTAGLLEIGERVRFRHPTIRSALYGIASADQRRATHRALAEATNAERDPDRRAWHFAEATSGTDEDVAAELESAATRAQSRGGLAAAAAFRERATALTPDPSRRAIRALAAARTHFEAGSVDAARAMIEASRGLPADDLLRARTKLLRAEISFANWRGGDAPAALLDAARELEPVDPDLARATYLEVLSAAMFAGRFAKEDIAAEASRSALACRFPDEPRPPDLLLQGLAIRFTEGYAAAAPALKEAISAFLAEPSLPPSDSRWLWFASWVALHLWDDASAFALSNRHLQIVRDGGALTALPFVLSNLSSLYAFMGQLGAAVALESELRAATDATAVATVPYGALTMAGLQGREEESLELLKTHVAQAESRGEGLALTIGEFQSGYLYIGLGRYAMALNALGPPERYYEEFPAIWVLTDLIEAAARSGQSDLGNRAFQLLAETTGVAGTDWALGMEARCRAVLGSGDDVDGLYREGIERIGGTKLRVQVARAHLLYGEWLRRERRRVEAREQLRTAFELFTAMGIAAFASRAERELLATGERVRKRTVETIQELTPQEAEVARLARDGHSNPEIGQRLFISSKTVEYHLHKVFDKLDINSRGQLSQVLPADVGVAVRA